MFGTFCLDIYILIQSKISTLLAGVKLFCIFTALFAFPRLPRFRKLNFIPFSTLLGLHSPLNESKSHPETTSWLLPKIYGFRSAVDRFNKMEVPFWKYFFLCCPFLLHTRTHAHACSINPGSLDLNPQQLFHLMHF